MAIDPQPGLHPPETFIAHLYESLLCSCQLPPDDDPTKRKEDRLVSLVLVSHSRTLAEGLRDMVVQVAGDSVGVAIAAGTEDGRLGTNALEIVDAIRPHCLRNGPQ